MATAKPINTPSASNAHMLVAFAPKSSEKKEYMARVPYASAVGSLMYVMVCTRPDFSMQLVLSVGLWDTLVRNTGKQ